jgi:hypothetical protein
MTYPTSFDHIPQEVRNTAGRIVVFRGGTPAQRRALEIKHGLRPAPRRVAA